MKQNKIYLQKCVSICFPPTKYGRKVFYRLKNCVEKCSKKREKKTTQQVRKAGIRTLIERRYTQNFPPNHHT